MESITEESYNFELIKLSYFLPLDNSYIVSEFEIKSIDTMMSCLLSNCEWEYKEY